MKTLMLLLFPLTLFAQTNTSTSDDLGSYGVINWEFSTGADESGDYEYFYMSFRNAEYQYAIDIGSILLFDLTEFDLFTKSLGEAVTRSGEKIQATWDIYEGTYIQLYDFSTAIYFYSDNKYSTLSPKKSQKMLDMLISERHRLE